MRLRLRLPFVVALVILVASACASNDSTPAIEPIEPILAGEIEFTLDPSGNAATLAVGTSIPVACSVIYGTDDSFGSIAVDNDMQGGAHSDHRPLLTGLTPDTEYRYVLQGSDAAGTIYRSDTMTFRTPVAAENSVGSRIIAAGVTDVSSQFSDAFAAENAIDGDLATEWSSAGDGDGAWIEIDLGQDHEITAVTFRTRQMTDGTAITETFTLTIDGATFGPFRTGAEPAELDQPVIGRVARIDAVTTTGGNTGATEIEFYGT